MPLKLHNLHKHVAPYDKKLTLTYTEWVFLNEKGVTAVTTFSVNHVVLRFSWGFFRG